MLKYDVERNFSYHNLNEDQKQKVETLRDQVKVLANLILSHCPENGETVLALRALETCSFQANASIARGQ